MSHNILTRSLTPADLPLLSRLHAKAFGPGRFARTAYRVREGTPPISRFCRTAFLGDRMVAAVGFTDIAIGRAPGGLLLGPLAVDPEFAGQGFAQKLVREALAQATDAGVPLVVLVGDEPYYARFGFKRVPPGQIWMPGPVDPMRLLAAELTPGSLATYGGLIAAEHS